jgi:hypothetical protein
VDEEVTKHAGYNDGEVLVSRHFLFTWGPSMLRPLLMRFLPVAAISTAFVALTKPLT